MKVMTWNIQYGTLCGPLNESKRRLHMYFLPSFANLDGIARKIKLTGADIVVLNEVDAGSPRTGFRNQAKYVADKAGYSYHTYFSTVIVPRIVTGHYTAVLSKEPVHLEKKMLRHKNVGVVRTSAEGIDYTVIAVHLDHRGNKIVEDLPFLAGLVGEQNGMYMAVGDFNFYDGLLEVFLNHVNNGTTRLVHSGSKEPTWPVKPGRKPDNGYPYYRLDHILVCPDLEIKEERVVKTIRSDHYPVVARLEPKLEERVEEIKAVGPA